MHPYLKYTNVDKELLVALPELKARYKKEANWQHEVGGEPGQYDVFCFVLKPFLRELLDKADDQELLRRVFEFFEEMARSPDLQVSNLLQVGIFRSLVGEPERLKIAWNYMGEETKNIARRTAAILQRDKNLPETN